MGRCPHCDESVDTLYDCPDCGDRHCVDCRLPRAHDCPEHEPDEPSVWERDQLTVAEVDDQGYWRYPAKLLVYTALALPMAGVAAVVSPLDGTPLGFVAVGAFALAFVVLFGAVFNTFRTLVAFRREPVLLAKTDAAWQPHWLPFCLGSLVVTPHVVAAFYLSQRHDEIGVPWTDLFSWLG